MAVPSSGLIRLSGIFSEINEDDYLSFNNDGETLRLSQMFDGTWGTINTNSADHPSNVNPDKMTEFYGYDHDATASSSLTEFNGSPGTTSSKSVCGQSVNGTYYHDGTGSIPATGDNVYGDSSGDEPLEDQYYRIMPTSGGSTTYRILVADGAVSGTVATC
mgnify:CR=1 FL=1|tara:strand:- start:461 stop:943 length:483 start_codon:yes stop_codon:yes gene_type:complete